MASQPPFQQASTSAPGMPPNWSPDAGARRSLLPLVLVAVLAFGLLAVAFVLLRGTDDGGGSALDTDAAREGVEAIVRDANEDPDSFGALDDCPLIDDRVLSRTIEERAGLDVDVDFGSTGGFAFDDDDGGLVVCIGTGDERFEPGTIVGVLIDEDGRRFREVRSDADGDVTRGPERNARGGTIESYCEELEDDPPSCTAGWHGGELLVLLEVSHEDVEADGVIDALLGSLDQIVDTLLDAG